MFHFFHQSYYNLNFGESQISKGFKRKKWNKTGGNSSHEAKASMLPCHDYCDEEPLVYASNQYEFALFYAGNDTNDLEINQSYYNGVYMLTEILPGMFRKVLDRPGYIYYLPSDTFEQIKYDEFVSRVAVKPVKTIRVSNVLKALKKRTEMFWFPKLPPFIDNRWDYAEKRCELFGDSYDEWKRRYVKLYRDWRISRD